MVGLVAAVVLLVPTTAPEDIFSYTQRVADAWKIGRAEVGDGVLLVMAKDDRRLCIATMQAVEGAIPDLAAKRIIDQVIAPYFRNGDYAAGLDAGVDRILALLRGENLPLPAESAAIKPPPDWVLLALGAVLANLLWRPWPATALMSLLGWRLTDSPWSALAVVAVTPVHEPVAEAFEVARELGA